MVLLPGAVFSKTTTSSPMQQFLAWLLAIMAICSQGIVSSSSSVHGPCVQISDCGPNEYCQEGHCACKDDYNLFDGACHPVRQFGEECGHQIQCSSSGDKYLQCEKL